jgi:exodeoxyribonuclease VII large subunit
MKVFSVSQITRYIRSLLESDLELSDIWISGEVTNASTSSAGHSYFTLRDEVNQIECVKFRDKQSSLLSDGSSILLHGRISIYETRGSLQCYVDMVQEQGLGRQQLAFEELKLKLEAEGLFDSSRKRSIPLFPKKLIAITSETGAVWQDIKNVITRRYPLLELILIPCQVQGINAVSSILTAFEKVKYMQNIDTIILARGGGAADELEAFNDESLIRAIYSCKIPVISAIGHESDTTLSDLVADMRAPTPSVAAEIAVPSIQELYSTITTTRRSLSTIMEKEIKYIREQIKRSARRLIYQTPNIDMLRQQVDEIITRNKRTAIGIIQIQQEKLKGAESHLAALDPTSILKRGYAIVTKSIDNKVIKKTDDANVQDHIEIHLSDGILQGIITKKS